jgi:hypothetical protein
MQTPFDNNFHSLSFNITDSIIQAGYFPLIKIPDLTTVIVDLGGCNDILSSAYEVLEITDDNSYLYSDEIVGTYIISWLGRGDISSSSSGYIINFELKDLIESGNYTTVNIKYISTT